MNPNDLRKRLQELLSIPERTRTDEQWDEIIELEIQTAKGNRADLVGTPMPTAHRNTNASGNPRRPQNQNPKPYPKQQQGQGGQQQQKGDQGKGGGEQGKSGQQHPRSQHPRGPRRPAGKPPTPSSSSST